MVKVEKKSLKTQPRSSSSNINTNKKTSVKGSRPKVQQPSTLAHKLQSRKDVRELQKKKRKERREQKEGFDLIQELKKDWERLRLKKLAKPEKLKLLSSMMEKTKGQIEELIFKHDAIRIIQSMIKFGSLMDREVIANELKGRLAKISTSKYGKFLILNLLRYYKPARETIAQEFYGQVSKLMKHSLAAPVINLIYSDWLNTSQARYHLLQELYHPEFFRFKTNVPLTELIQTRSLTAIQDHLLQSIRPCIEKGIAGPLTMIQKAILDYLSISTLEQQQSLLRELHPVLLSMVHQKEGSLVAMKAISLGLPKDRKVILKSFKSLVMKMAQDEFGYRVLIQALDTVDDVVLLEKSILKELDYTVLPTQRYVARVVRFLITGRSSRAFPDTFLNLLDHQGKKDPFVRYTELFQLMSLSFQPLLLTNLMAWLSIPTLVPLVLDYLARVSDPSPFATLLSTHLSSEPLHNLSASLFSAVQKLIKYVSHWDHHAKSDTFKEGYLTSSALEEGHTALRTQLLKNQVMYTSMFLTTFTGPRLFEFCTSSSQASFMVLALCEVEIEKLGGQVCDKLYPFLSQLQLLSPDQHGIQLICEVLTTNEKKKHQH